MPLDSSNTIIKNWKSTETMKKTKSSFHEKIDKIGKFLTMFTKTKLNNTKKNKWGKKNLIRN